MQIYHGRGRQSKTQFYRHRERMSALAMKEWREELHDAYGDWEAGPAIVTIKRVRALPLEEHQRATERCQDSIRAAKRQLAVLARTPTRKRKETT